MGSRAGSPVVTELHTVAEMGEVVRLLAEVWGRPADPPVGTELLVALAHSGNFVAGVRQDDTLVAASVAFLGREQNDDVVLHSHITGVARVAQGAGVGLALKRYQRRWALDRGLSAVTWTFDPLVRRNGRFNLARLGAVATAFVPNLYGTVQDRFNAGDETDRCVVRWGLSDDHPSALCDEARLIDSGASMVLDEDPDGAPRPGLLLGETRLCRVPPDIVALRAEQPMTARAWRSALRLTLGASMAEGYLATGMTGAGSYVLERPR